MLSPDEFQKKYPAEKLEVELPDSPIGSLRDLQYLYGKLYTLATTGGGTLRCARIEQDASRTRRADTAHVTVRWRAAFGDVGALLADRSPDAAWLGADGPFSLRWRERLG